MKTIGKLRNTIYTNEITLTGDSYVTTIDYNNTNHTLENLLDERFKTITVSKELALKSSKIKCEVAFCPERIAQGNSINEIYNLPQIIIETGLNREYPFSDIGAHIVGYLAPPNTQDIKKDNENAVTTKEMGKAVIQELNILLGK